MKFIWTNWFIKNHINSGTWFVNGGNRMSLKPSSFPSLNPSLVLKPHHKLTQQILNQSAISVVFPLVYIPAFKLNQCNQYICSSQMTAHEIQMFINPQQLLPDQLQIRRRRVKPLFGFLPQLFFWVTLHDNCTLLVIIQHFIHNKINFNDVPIMFNSVVLL